GDVKTETGTASEVENAERRRALQLQVLHAPDVEFQPALYVHVFCVVLGRIAIALLDRAQLRLIEPIEQRLETNRMQKAPRFAQAPPIGFPLRELSEFMRDVHAATKSR